MATNFSLMARAIIVVALAASSSARAEFLWDEKAGLETPIEATLHKFLPAKCLPKKGASPETDDPSNVPRLSDITKHTHKSRPSFDMSSWRFCHNHALRSPNAV